MQVLGSFIFYSSFIFTGSILTCNAIFPEDQDKICFRILISQPVQTRTREGATETIYGNITQLKILITNKKPQLEKK
jgi:hypothetical protein